MLRSLNGIIVVMKHLICLSLSPKLLFHLEGIDTPHEAWEQLENLFGKTDAIHGHQLENELITLNPNNFDPIQDFILSSKLLGFS